MPKNNPTLFDIATSFVFAVVLTTVAGAIVGACSCAPVPPKPPEPGTPDASVPGATCDTACAKLRELGCSEAKPTAEGSTCEEVCLNVQSSGVVVWDLGCRSAITSCSQVDSCEH